MFFGAWTFFFALCSTVYFRAINGGFIWDDVSYLIENPLIHSQDALYKIWFSKETLDYWPLTYSLFRLEWLCFGPNPIGYHIVNLALHALCCVLLWRLLSRLQFPFPFFAALIFCVHPLNVEAVAWIFQTKTTLSTALILASTLFYWRCAAPFCNAAASNATALQKRAAHLVSVFLFVLANLAKVSGVMWPLVLLGYEWYRGAMSSKKK